MAITQQFFWPNATPGSTTPPTPSTKPPTIPTPPSSVAYNQVTVQLTGDSTSTSAVITHNFALTAGELAALWPEVRFESEVSGGPSGYVIARTANNVTVGFSTTSSVTFGLVRLFRPFSPAR